MRHYSSPGRLGAVAGWKWGRGITTADGSRSSLLSKSVPGHNTSSLMRHFLSLPPHLQKTVIQRLQPPYLAARKVGESLKFTPGVCVRPDYFTGDQADLFRSHFYQYYEKKEPTSPLYHCPFCNDSEWYDPMKMMQHLNWCHSHDGYRPEELTAANERCMSQLVEYCNTKFELGKPRGARLILFVDVANMELSFPDSMLRLLLEQNALAHFQHHAMAICVVHELFVPHTAKVTHTAYQLAQCHPHSDFFPFFAVSRSESGDLTTIALMTQIRLRAGTKCPPMMLLTNDLQQKKLAAELFGHATPPYATPGCVIAPRTSFDVILGRIQQAVHLQWS